MLKASLSPALLKKIAKVVAIVVAGIAVLGFLVLPAVLRPVLEKKLAEQLHRTVVIRSLSFNPFALSVALKGVTISQRDSAEAMVSFDEFYLNLESLSLVKHGLIVSSVRLVKPYLNVRRNKDFTYNFSDLIPPSEPVKEEKPGQAFKFSINNIEVKNGSVDFIDMPKNTSHTVRDLIIAIPFVSNLPYYLSSYVEPAFLATINGTPIALRGKTLPFNETLETTLDINWKGVDIPYYLTYSPVPLKLRLLSGRLDVQATISFKQFKNRPPTVSVKGTIALNDIRLGDIGKKRLLEFSQLSISFFPSDLMEKEVHLSDVSLRAPKMYVERDRGGELVIMKAILAQLGVSQGKQEPAPAKEGPMPVIDVDQFSIRDGMLLFLDWQPIPAPAEGEEDAQQPARVLIDNIALKASSVSTRKDSKGKLELSLNINKKGTVRAAGSLGLVPLDLETTVNITNIELSPLQPYAAQKADILVNDGRFSADGIGRIRAGQDGVLSESYRGSASVSSLDLRDSRNDDELLSWRQLNIVGIDAGSRPPALKIKTVALTGFVAGIVVEEDGELNLKKVVKQAAPADEKTSPPAAGGQAPAQGPITAPQIAIGQVVLKAGTVNFTDRHVKPLYTASLFDVEGRVTGLTSRKDLLADVLVRASLDRYAPLVITGKIHPLGNLSADIRADFKHMELSMLTPYSGTYIGNAIEKGKLSFGLEYHIANNKLEAKNEIFIDQLTLGEKIESPKATSLPVALAIALLKDRKGEIKLDIPVSGRIDNPEFRVGKVILQVLVNLLTKAATSPFALLGSLMGGEELGYVEFDYGGATVTQENAKKIDTLVNALSDRPGLKLEVTGHADPTNDREALRTTRMKSLIAAQKIKDLPGDERAVNPESVQVSAAEYPVYLKKAYRSGKFPKPRNVLGFAKDIPDAEMEKLLLTSIEVTDDDLRQLAASRARIVRDGILQSQKIEPERVFLLEPRSLAPEKKDKLRDSRVEFSLK